jgi:hypothetical protein
VRCWDLVDVEHGGIDEDDEQEMLDAIQDRDGGLQSMVW